MSLQDITNTPPTSQNTLDITTTPKVRGGAKTIRKRLSDGTVKEYKYTAARKHVELVFSSESERLKFDNDLEKARIAVNCKTLKDTIIHLVTAKATERQIGAASNTLSPSHYGINTTYSVSSTSGVNTTDSASSQPGVNTTESASSQHAYSHFVCEMKQMEVLCADLCNHQCHCQQRLQVVKTAQTGHAAQITLQCAAEHIVYWTSSVVMGSNFAINYIMLQAYLVSGMATIQYEKLCDFADIGKPSSHFQSNVVTTLSSVVSSLAEESCRNARTEEATVSHSEFGGAIGIMTDARHACRKNSFHTDHVALGMKTHKVVHYQHVTKKQERCSQKHETLGAELMYQYFDNKNITVKVHVHDNNGSISKRIG